DDERHLEPVEDRDRRQRHRAVPVADRRHHLGVVDELHRRADAGLRVGGVIERNAFHRIGVVAGIGLLDREQEAVLRPEALCRVAAADRPDKPDLDPGLVLAERSRRRKSHRRRQRKSPHQTASRNSANHLSFLPLVHLATGSSRPSEVFPPMRPRPRRNRAAPTPHFLCSRASRAAQPPIPHATAMSRTTISRPQSNRLPAAPARRAAAPAASAEAPATSAAAGVPPSRSLRAPKKSSDSFFAVPWISRDPTCASLPPTLTSAL